MVCNLSNQLISGYSCIFCDTSCGLCTGPSAAECRSCNEGSFLFANSTGSYCLQICPTGYIPDRHSNQCVTSLIDISQAQSGTLMGALVVTSATFTVSSVISGGFSASMMMCLVATESLANMQYLNINHSNLASTFYTGMSSSFVPNWFILFNTIQKDALVFNWRIFQQNQISSLYFDNNGDLLTEIMLYVAILLLALFFTLFSKSGLLINSFTGKAYIAAFSFLVSNVLGNMQVGSTHKYIILDIYLNE